MIMKNITINERATMCSAGCHAIASIRPSTGGSGTM